MGTAVTHSLHVGKLKSLCEVICLVSSVRVGFIGGLGFVEQKCMTLPQDTKLSGWAPGVTGVTQKILAFTREQSHTHDTEVSEVMESSLSTDGCLFSFAFGRLHFPSFLPFYVSIYLVSLFWGSNIGPCTWWSRALPLSYIYSPW